ncbi:2'-5' RNA ligase family protein [Halohasta salina]|uniref:2'-5' RNA ligase family protein n=1 Tax=Halohasta salina TaxID=2961621 RepID=UPI0020A362FF|nr:2'-5' RNA ligase family protein [Halohasta salina]
MFSLNVPVPGAVARVAAELHPQLVGFDSRREQHTLVVKRFDESTLRASQPELQLATLQQQLPQKLTGTPAFEAAVREIDFFAEPARGEGPVVYLAVESPGLRELHEELVDAYEAIEGLEGVDYVPHVTLARGGSVVDAERVAGEIEGVSWAVSELVIWDSRYREAVSRYSLPA